MGTHSKTKGILHAYVILLFLSACVYALMYAPQPMFGTLSREFGIDRTTTGLSVTVFMLSLAISPLCAGLILKRLGNVRILAISICAVVATGFCMPFVETYAQFLALRFIEGLAVPMILTSLMTTIAELFRHLDLGRALAGYVASNLLGTVCGRILCGLMAEHLGWRWTLSAVCFSFVLALFTLHLLPKSHQHGPVHHLKDYLLLFRQKGVMPLLLVEACGIFVFAAIGNLIPFRIAELGFGNSESLAGFMYLGYSTGLVATFVVQPLIRLLGGSRRFLLFSSAFFLLSFFSMACPSLWVLFGGLWFVAAGEFLVHALCPSLINRLGSRSGECERSMINGFFLSVYYMSGVLGTMIPSALYSLFGWTVCYALLQGVLFISFITIFIKCHDV